jgi:hypothetical protein
MICPLSDLSQSLTRMRSAVSANTLPSDVSTTEALVATAEEAMVPHRYDTSPVRGRQPEYVPRNRQQTQSEISSQSSRPFALRPTAAIFVPRQQAETITQAPDVPADVPQFYPAPMEFSPYAVGASGLPMYYHMYTVPLGPGGGYDFKSHWKQTSPKKRRNKKTFAPRGRKIRSDETSSSPTKSEQFGGSSRVDEPRREEGERGTPSSRPVSVAESQRTNTEQLRQSVGSLTGNTSYEPFASQLDVITRQAAEQKDEPKTMGRGSRRIDWANVRNVHYHTQQQMTSQGYGPYEHWAQQSSHPGPSNHSRRRHWHASAGVPLESTAPFPDPVAPTGPSRSESSISSSKEYVGYVAPQETSCGEFKIETAAEWGGRACNTCDKSDRE